MLLLRGFDLLVHSLLGRRIRGLLRGNELARLRRFDGMDRRCRLREGGGLVMIRREWYLHWKFVQVFLVGMFESKSRLVGVLKQDRLNDVEPYLCLGWMR